MKTLIIPICGTSTRFPNMRPKWLLCHPNGNLMLTESIRGMKPEQYNKILIIALIEHEKKYTFRVTLVNEICKEYGICPTNVSIVLIDSSKNQPDTIYQGIQTYERDLKLDDQIVIKDCDNQFDLDVMEGNSIAVCDIKETKSPANKSYVQIGEQNSVVNIVEKQVISNQFCCGAYSFEDIYDFVCAYEKLKDNDNLYVSHIIYKMILDKKLFFTTKATNYVDWGTLDNWLEYKAQFKTLFIDLDGVLVKSSSKHFKPFWGTTEGIQKNIDSINKLYNTGKVQVIITTARPQSYLQDTQHQLEKIELQYHQLLMGFQHCQRILINDYSDTNPYPSAIAINLKRNSDELDKLL